VVDVAAVRHLDPAVRRGIEALHQPYAKEERIDTRAPVTAAYEVGIDAPVQRVWDLLVNPLAWPSFAPDVHDVHLDGPVAADARSPGPTAGPG
jgi:hypothetical protein